MSNDSISDRLASLRERMDAEKIDACIVPTGDPHMSEYISDHDKVREFITGFTGSAGTAVVTAEDAGLWTDSRYFLQAEDELSGSDFALHKDGLSDTPTIYDYLKETIKRGSRVSVDGKLVSVTWAERFRKETASHGLELVTDLDLPGEIWEGRPERAFGPVKDYPLQYAGVSRRDKIQRIREDMEKEGADLLVLSALSDIAWLLNLRGSDIKCNPVFFSFVIMTAEHVHLYGKPEVFAPELKEALGRDGVELLEYETFYDQLPAIEGSVMLDREICSERILQALPKSVTAIDGISPVVWRKAIKNPVEVEGIRSAHRKDGVAMCKFLYWLKRNVGSIAIDEISAADKLHELRAEQELFMGDSFEPICGYGPHGAIVHYSATRESNAKLHPRGLFLVDSGGHYLDGTTDVTRTIVLGPLTEREKTMFTAVLRGHINLARAKFPKGLGGENLDYLAHEPLWRMGLDYRHATGHGVGHYLNVHEGPNRISWKGGEEALSTPALEEGMLTSDEPGYYEDGEFGIRHESLLLCLQDEETEYGPFMGFEEVTLVPFDLEGIAPEQMEADEIDYLNRYHEIVYKKISPFLDPKEREWLRQATKAIAKVS